MHVTAKSKISIGTTAAAANLAGFQADTYTQIKGVEDLGEWGAEHEELTSRNVETGLVKRRKGIKDSGVIELVCARSPDDAGQDALRAALASDLPYNFKVELTDKLNATGTNTFFYFKAVVLSERNQFGPGDSIVKVVFRLGIDGAIIEDPATAGA